MSILTTPILDWLFPTVSSIGHALGQTCGIAWIYIAEG